MHVLIDAKVQTILEFIHSSLCIPSISLSPSYHIARVSNEFVNQYWPVLYKEMIAETREIWEPIFVREANKMTLNVPFRTFMYFSEDA